MSAAWAVHPQGINPRTAADISLAGLPDHAPLRVLQHGAPEPQWAGYHGRVSESSRAAGEILLAEAAQRIVAALQRSRGELPA